MWQHDHLGIYLDLNLYFNLYNFVNYVLYYFLEVFLVNNVFF